MTPTSTQDWLIWLSHPEPKGLARRPAPLPAGEPETIARLLFLSTRHNIHMMIHRNLLTLLREDPFQFLAGPAERVEAEALALAADIRNLRMQNVAVTMNLAALSRDILKPLSGEKVALIKGLDFAQAAYGGLENRGFGDIDLLVAEDAGEAVASALTGLGLRFVEPKGKKIAQTERQWVLSRPGAQPCLVEVHTDLVHDPKLRRRLTLDHALYASEASGGVTQAARLVLAALHGATSHLFARLQYVLDGMMIARSGVDRQELAERAARSGATRCVAVMLALADQIYGCEASGDLARSLPRSRFDGWDHRLITPRMVLSAKDENRWRSLPQRYLYRLLLTL